MKTTAKLIAAVLCLTMVFSPLAFSDTLNEQPLASDPQPFYSSFTGTVKEIYEKDEGTTKVYLEGSDEAPAYFILTENTYFVDDVAIEAGKEITGYYESGRPMIMIYPPQYTIDIVAPAAAEMFMKADKFDENLVSQDNMLKLNLAEDTEIVWENNTQIYWFKAPTVSELEAVLGNRRLIVFYEFSTKSIPAQTTPKKIIVLSQQEHEAIGIYIDDVLVEGPEAYVDDNGIVMVPLRAAAEALGYEVSWNNESRSVTVGSDVTVAVGNKTTTVSGYGFELETAPEILSGRTFVPLSFFKEALNVRMSQFFENNIIIQSGRFTAE
ncbi:MAG: stalk domain-containing protein [Sedimentibacter sp.]|uniref:stalk domain-containing protein n=1 Tax=Sedimentibacter sp. TaxID=1960295 RepID=UPI003158D095